MTTRSLARRPPISPDLAPDFDAFYRREYPQMVAVSRALLHDGAGAEDLAQEAFMAAHHNWHRIAHYDDPRAWVRRVLVNRATSLRRRLGAEVRALTRLGHDPERGTVPDISPEATEVWDQVRRLPRRQQQAIVLYYVDQLGVEEVGKVMGCSAGAVKSHLHRGREVLRKSLSAWSEEEL